MGHMDINNILTENEYTEDRSAEELFEFAKQKEKQLKAWTPDHSDAKTRREIRYRELEKGLPKKFRLELTPFSYYANTYYGNKPEVRLIPCCGSEQYDGIIVDNNKKIFVEIADAALDWKWGLQKELLIENGCSPWAHNIHGVKGNKTKRNRSASDIITSIDSPSHKDTICKAKESVKNTAEEKCKKSLNTLLPYGQNTTVLIVTFDDTVVRPSIHKSCWDDFVNFKRNEIDPMEHNFSKIILFGWLDKKFID